MRAEDCYGRHPSRSLPAPCVAYGAPLTGSAGAGHDESTHVEIISHQNSVTLGLTR